MSYQPLTTANVSALVYGGATATSGSNLTFTTGQSIMVVNKTTGSPTSVTLPLIPILWEPYIIKDGKGDAATNNITIAPASGTIDGAISVTLNTNYGSIGLIFNGLTWNQTNSGSASSSSGSSSSGTTLVTNSLFVSPTGSDNSGAGSVTSPYLTIGYAVSQALNGQTIYLTSGTYYPSVSVPLYAANNNITITAYPGQTAIIDGSSTLDPIFSLSQVQNATITGLQFQNSKPSSASYGAIELSLCQNAIISNNFINNCYNGVTCLNSRSSLINNNKITNSTIAGVLLSGSSNNNTISSNLIDTVTVSGTGLGSAGVIINGGSNNQIIHNQIQNCGGCAIAILSNDATTSCLANMVQFNYCPNNCTSTSATNCGVMYHVNLGKMLNNACIIDGNWFAVLRPLPNNTNQTSGIYLDDYTSGTTVTNNIVIGGAYCINIQGGQNNVFRNNVFDMGVVTATTTGAGYIQGLTGFTNGSMSGNQISGNIVYSTASTAPTVWSNATGGTATIVGNFYYNTNAQAMTTNVGISDSSPVAANPQFVNASGGIYDIAANSAPVFQGFIPINQGLLGLLPTVTAATTSAKGTPSVINNSVAPGIYTFTTVVVNAQGLITSISSNSSSGAVPTTLTGDVTGTGLGTFTTTLAASGVSPGSYQGLIINSKGIITSAVNAGYLTTNQPINVSGDVFGTGTTSLSLSLVTTGVVAGTYAGLVVNAKGLIVSASNVSFLSANQNIIVSGDATGSGSTAIALTLSASGVTPGTYQGLSVNSKGQVISAINTSYISANQSITVTGDVSGSGATAIALTLAAVGTVGTYSKVTTDAKGRVVSGTVIASADVTTALGFTPYNASNPAAYISTNKTITVTGDVTGSGATAIALTLAATGVLAGTYQGIVVNTKGLVTAASSVSGGTVLTTGSSYTFAAGQFVLVVNKTTGSATTVTLPASPLSWLPYVIKDGKGDAATNNITIQSSAMIDGNASIVMNYAYQSNTLYFDGSTWRVT